MPEQESCAPMPFSTALYQASVNGNVSHLRSATSLYHVSRRLVYFIALCSASAVLRLLAQYRCTKNNASEKPILRELATLINVAYQSVITPKGKPIQNIASILTPR